MSFGNCPNFFLNFSECEVNGEEKHFYRFKSFRLDVKERQLLHNNLSVSLTPKAFDVLVVLVERNGHLVEKDELLRIVWADSFVEEVNVARIVHTLRKVLGEEENGNKFIETVAKKGYRFVAKVNEVRTSTAPKSTNDKQDSSTAAENFSEITESEKISETELQIPPMASGNLAVPPISEPKHKTRIILFTVGFLSAIFLIVLLSFNFQSKSSINPNKVKSIAVLPLKPINTANRDELYEIGIADSLIHRFSSMKGFVVRPLSATRKYADIAQDPLAAGREQQVDYVLASNYQLAGGKIKVTAQLINVASGQIEETYKSEKEAGDVFAMQDAIAGEVGNILLARFVTTSSSLTAKRGTINEEAYRLYLQAMYLYDKRTPADARKAVELLEQAIQLDSNFARAWAGKAHAHRALGNFGGNTHEEYKKSIEAINKALALDENLADAHSALCENKYFYELDFDGAELECKRAIELDPHSSLAHQIYSRNLLPLGRFDESIAEIKIAIDLEPTSLFSQRNFGVSFYYARRFDEAASQFKRVIEMDPNFVAPYPFLINTLTLQGNEAEAFEWFLKWLAVQKTDDETVQIFKAAYQTSGWQGVGRERVKRFDESKIRTYFMEACMAAQAGDKDKAFEYLEKSYQRREWGMGYLGIEPSLDPLRGDPHFDELVRRVGLK
jgi:DNA-binding winged helix-turn-helix (wHTH) protein/tetratricopeptide (TPR) repeat protein